MRTKKLFGVLSLLMMAIACGETKEPESPACQPPAPCPDDQGDDEVGEEPPPPLECTSSTVDGKQGLKYQCEGSLSMGFEFTLLDKGCDNWLVWPPCEQAYSFGYEDYVETKVMACCDAWDGSDEHGAVVREYCTGDLVEQICLSAAEQLKAGADMLDDGAVKEGVIKLQNHVAENIDECITALWTNDSAEDEVLVSHWSLGDLFGLKDIELVVGSGEITSFLLPDDAEVCESNQYNNMETFVPPQPLPASPGDLRTLVEGGSLRVAGPTLFGSVVSGEGQLASGSIVFARADSGELLMSDSRWIAAGPIQLSNELGSVSIEDGRIELRGGARVSGSDRDSRVEVGKAHFVLLGRVDGQVRRVVGSNATPIEVIGEGDLMYTSSFEVVVVDEQSQRWVAILPASQWR